MNNPMRIRGPLLFAGLTLAVVMLAGFAPVSSRYFTWTLQRQGPFHLDVDPLAQSLTTSCGEAAITMAHNYAHPDDPVSEQMVIDFARERDYFTPGQPPYTSPANMVRIARNYASRVSAGHVTSASQGLTLLIRRLQDGDPVIIDVLTRLDAPSSEAHFVVVTGVSLDLSHGNAVIIHFNDPLSGRSESAVWAGDSGIWNAWQNNGDPGGAGWWMVIE